MKYSIPFDYYFCFKGYLSEQVNADEIGALQGAADTVRTMSNMIAYVILSNVFAYCIR